MSKNFAYLKQNILFLKTVAFCFPKPRLFNIPFWSGALGQYLSLLENYWKGHRSSDTIWSALQRKVFKWPSKMWL